MALIGTHRNRDIADLRSAPHNSPPLLASALSTHRAVAPGSGSGTRITTMDGSQHHEHDTVPSGRFHPDGDP